MDGYDTAGAAVDCLMGCDLMYSLISVIVLDRVPCHWIVGCCVRRPRTEYFVLTPKGQLLSTQYSAAIHMYPMAMCVVLL